MNFKAPASDGLFMKLSCESARADWNLLEDHRMSIFGSVAITDEALIPLLPNGRVISAQLFP